MQDLLLGSGEKAKMKTQIDENITTKEFIEKYSWMSNVRDGWYLKRRLKDGKLELRT
jgi:hypothetical protein